MAKVGEKVIRSFMPDQHREFFAQLPFILVGSIADDLQPTASIMTGPSGFISSPTDKLVQIKTSILNGDPLAKNLTLDSPIALLGIQPHTKRRNRMNGWVIEKNDYSVLVEVQQSFGNCAKYITERYLEYLPRNSTGDIQISDSLNDSQIRLINHADTFFIATAHPDAINPDVADQGVDISHRGGKSGFVSATPFGIRFPDYSGNFFFNSFGNLKLNPAAGFIFFDFEKGNVLQIDTDVEIKKANPSDIELGIQHWGEAKIKQVKFYESSLSLTLSGN